MHFFGILLGLSAAFTWATASLVSHKPVRHFGAFEFVRIQLPTSALLLCIIVTAMGTWNTVTWNQWDALVISGVVGILLGDLLMQKCMQHGGPRRMHILFAMNAPMAALLGYWLLGETLSLMDAVGGSLMLLGVCMAILFSKRVDSEHILEKVEGSLLGVILWGLGAALCQAIGLVAIKPAIVSGIDPLAASALRTGGSAVLILLLGLFPAWRFRSVVKAETGVFIQCVIAGWLGYVLAMSLMLIALKYYNTG
ncbi:MAG: DMT family transporter, partial [Anaerolineae bacterium]|nr:DMT family transporter [Anaerolineae bacterium]